MGVDYFLTTPDYVVSWTLQYQFSTIEGAGEFHVAKVSLACLCLSFFTKAVDPPASLQKIARE